MKAILTQEQAKVLEFLKSESTVGEIATAFVGGELYLSEGEGFDPYALDKVGLHTFMTAIYVGYEVEKSPADKVREIYEQFSQSNEHEEFFANDLKRVIKDVLNALDVPIEGVNAF